MASLGVPYVLMHMRGNSITMQEPNNTTYDDVCTDVGNELQFTASEAIAAGIAPWSLMLDPGEWHWRCYMGSLQHLFHHGQLKLASSSNI